MRTDEDVQVAATLRMTDIHKAFPGVQALAGVSLAVQSGTVHAVVGENGAGKSTLMKILAGVYQADHGTIEIDRQTVSLADPRHAQELGIAMVYQELELVADMSVAENISLGAMPSRFGFVDRRSMLERADHFLSQLRTDVSPTDKVGNLPIGQQQLVEIAKCYARSARIVLFDEPTSSLSEKETEALFGVIADMTRQGIAVVYISHRLSEVARIADEVTILKDGALVTSRPSSEMTTDQMINLMVGRELVDLFPKTQTEIGDVVLSVENLTRTGVFSDVSFHVRRGEVVGLAGLVGSGRTEVARAIFGLDAIDKGEICVDGTPRRIESALDAVRAGIAYVPEDRKSEGIVPRMTVRENMSLPVLRRLSRSGFVRRRAEKAETGQLAVSLDVSPPNPNVEIETLSGGNQQKVMLGRWLATDPSVLILDEPTRGVDVGAKAEIHRLIGRLADRGVSIIVISSELPEVLAASDRVYVLRSGRIAGEYARAEATEERVMRTATGEAA